MNDGIGPIYRGRDGLWYDRKTEGQITRITQTPDWATLTLLLPTWEKVVGTRSAASSQVIECAQKDAWDWIVSAKTDAGRLWAILLEVAGNPDGSIDHRILGEWLAKHLDLAIDGARLMRGRDVNGSRSWWLCRTAPRRGRSLKPILPKIPGRKRGRPRKRVDPQPVAGNPPQKEKSS